MYNQYLDGDSFVLLDPEPQPQHSQSPPNRGHNSNQRRPDQPHSSGQFHPQEPMRSKNDLLKDVTSGLSKVLDGVKQHFSLEKFDTGDILLVLIILFLYLEDGDNLELVITLGLLLLLGLDEEARESAYRGAWNGAKATRPCTQLERDSIEARE